MTLTFNVEIPDSNAEAAVLGVARTYGFIVNDNSVDPVDFIKSKVKEDIQQRLLRVISSDAAQTATAAAHDQINAITVT